MTRLMLTESAEPELDPSEADAPGVVRIGRIAAPGAALIPERRRQHLRGLVPAAGIAGTAVVFRVDGLGEDDGALLAQLLDQHVVARRKIDVVARVAAAGRAHVLGVEGILEREHDAIHRHRFEVGIAPVRGVELGRALERIGKVAEILAHRRRAGRQRSERGMPVEFAAAGDRALAPDVEGGKCIHLAGIRDADDHSELLLDFGIGSGRLHAAEFERWPLVLVEIAAERLTPCTVWVGKRSGAIARTAPVSSGTAAPSSVTSALATPLKHAPGRCNAAPLRRR